MVPDLAGDVAPERAVALSWLAVDGYAFDLAYFDHRRWLVRRERPRGLTWNGSAEYAPRAMDQGFGRALWFVHGARLDRVAAAVEGFAPDRRGDLWAGVGLAARFAGAASPRALGRLRSASGAHADQLALGAVFAATAAGDAAAPAAVADHAHRGVHELTGLSVEQACEMAVATQPVTGDAAGADEYEGWRTRIRHALTLPTPRPFVA